MPSKLCDAHNALRFSCSVAFRALICTSASVAFPNGVTTSFTHHLLFEIILFSRTLSKWCLYFIVICLNISKCVCEVVATKQHA